MSYTFGTVGHGTTALATDSRWSGRWRVRGVAAQAAAMIHVTLADMRLSKAEAFRLTELAGGRQCDCRPHASECNGTARYGPSPLLKVDGTARYGPSPLLKVHGTLRYGCSVPTEHSVDSVHLHLLRCGVRGSPVSHCAYVPLFR